MQAQIWLAEFKQLFATDILKVLYAPQKAFKKIVENPKYWGAIAIFVIFIAMQTGFIYAQSEKIHYEQTFPYASTGSLNAWTNSSELWQVSPSSASISNNYIDTLNNTFYGNSSLQFAASDTDSISMTLSNFDSVRVAPDRYQNLSMRIKIVEPSVMPSNVKLTLYSLSESSYFQYDLTSEFSDATANTWNNLTIPVGSDSANWQTTGAATWENITSLRLDFTFPSSSDVTIRIQGLFFRGFYQTFTQISSTLFIVTILQQIIFQFIFMWLLFTGLMYIIIKGLKGNVVWKPLFIAVGFALVVLIIQSLLSLAATATLPTVYSPIEYQTALAGEAQIVNDYLVAQTATYTTISAIITLATYAWLSILGAFIIRALVPEFNWSKSILTSAAAIIVTIVLMGLLGV